MPPAPEAVGMGEFLVRHADEAPSGLAILGLGSCVAVFLHEPERRLAGLAHVMLPEPLEGSPLTQPGRFAPTAVAGMLDAILQRGGRASRLKAKLAGGAHMFRAARPERETLGERNVRAALAALERESIRVEAIDVGGARGRTLLADVATGLIRVTTLRGSPRVI